MPLVSVVMPAYNAESYISKAFDSLLCQTLKDWECIVVNDGSTDSTLSIIKRYSSQDNRIKYKSIENSGSAKIPRDIAITMAQSEWIMALDADDFLECNVLEGLLNRQLQTGADMVLLKLVNTDESGVSSSFSIPSSDFDFTRIFSSSEAVMLTVGSQGWTIPCNGLINKRLYESREINSNHMNADEYDSRVMMLAADSIALVDVSYYYRVNNNSITRKPTAKVFENLITNRMLVDLFSRNFGSESREYTVVNDLYIRSVAESFIRLGIMSNSMSCVERSKARRLIKSEAAKVSINDILRSPMSLKYKVVSIMPWRIQYLVGKLYKKLNERRKKRI